MSFIQRWALCAGLVVGSFVPTAASPIACAGEGPRAALVVDTGQGVQTFCVALPDSEVSGLELITLAGEQHGLSYRFGFGGEAVCMLAHVGTTGDDCFESYPDFWGYWRGSSNGGWTWSSSGAGGTSVGDGDVEGWSWGSGNDGTSHQRPPDTTFSSVCPVAAKPAGEGSTSAGGEGARPRRDEPAQRGDRAGPDSSPVPEPAALGARKPASPRAAEPPGRKKKPERPKPRARNEARELSRAERFTPAPTPDAVLASDELAAKPEPDGVPASGLAALGLAALLGAAGFVIARRRRGPA